MKGLAIAVFAARIAYGAGLIAAPDRLARSWLGPLGDPARVALRATGGREIAVHGFGLAAVLRNRPVAPWLLVSIAGDLNDIAATFAARGALPAGAAPKTAAVAGASAAFSGALLAACSR